MGFVPLRINVAVHWWPHRELEAAGDENITLPKEVLNNIPRESPIPRYQVALPNGSFEILLWFASLYARAKPKLPTRACRLERCLTVTLKARSSLLKLSLRLGLKVKRSRSISLALAHYLAVKRGFRETGTATASGARVQQRSWAFAITRRRLLGSLNFLSTGYENWRFPLECSEWLDHHETDARTTNASRMGRSRSYDDSDCLARTKSR